MWQTVKRITNEILGVKELNICINKQHAELACNYLHHFLSFTDHYALHPPSHLLMN